MVRDCDCLVALCPHVKLGVIIEALSAFLFMSRFSLLQLLMLVSLREKYVPKKRSFISLYVTYDSQRNLFSGA